MLSLTLFLYLANVFFEIQVKPKQIAKASQDLITKNQISANENQDKNKNLPVRLKIPGIEVDATIDYVGLTFEGEMEVPSSIINVGWFYLGSRPGERGSSVIAGHFSGENGEAGVFANLNKLKKGDLVSVERSDGSAITFIVQKSQEYNPGYAENVFSLSDRPRLNLITCDGVWDETKKSYSKRLVVFAERLN
jgi:LPXTG-site transpeptidase (sortase) family protein